MQQGGPLTGEPCAPSWIRTLTMSMGWMTQVASMPLAPPFTKGLMLLQTVLFLGRSPMAASASPAQSPAAEGRNIADIIECVLCVPELCCSSCKSHSHLFLLSGLPTQLDKPTGALLIEYDAMLPTFLHDWIICLHEPGVTCGAVLLQSTASQFCLRRPHLWPACRTLLPLCPAPSSSATQIRVATLVVMARHRQRVNDAWHVIANFTATLFRRPTCRPIHERLLAGCYLTCRVGVGRSCQPNSAQTCTNCTAGPSLHARPFRNRTSAAAAGASCSGNASCLCVHIVARLRLCIPVQCIIAALDVWVPEEGRQPSNLRDCGYMLQAYCGSRSDKSPYLGALSGPQQVGRHFTIASKFGS